MYLADRIRNRRRRYRPTHAPPGHTVALRETVDCYGSLPHSFQAGDGNMLGAVIQNVVVNLVGDRQYVVFHTQIAEQFQFPPAEYLSRGIVWRVEDDRLGVMLKSLAKFLFVKCPLTVRILSRP